MSTSVTLCTTAEVARLAGVDSSTVRRWVEKMQLIPTITTPGGHYRFDRDYVMEMLSRLPETTPRSRAAEGVAS